MSIVMIVSHFTLHMVKSPAKFTLGFVTNCRILEFRV